MDAEDVQYTTTWCPTCGGVSHPATGCAYTATFVVCWQCVLDFAEWVQDFTNNKGRRRGRPAFYDHVGGPPPRTEA